MTTANTRFDYLYRDASNYKSWGSVVFCGELHAGLSARLRAALESTEFFIADQIRIPEVFLVPDWPLLQDDHCWHEFVKAEVTSDTADDSHDRTIEEFVVEVEHAAKEGWKIF